MLLQKKAKIVRIENVLMVIIAIVCMEIALVKRKDK